MIKLKSGFLLFGVMAFIFLTQSCVKKPFACFSTIPPEDSIYKNIPVFFTAACTDNGDDFNWQLYNIPDSVYFGRSFTTTFKDTGIVNVYLLVVTGGNSSGYTKNITVKP